MMKKAKVWTLHYGTHRGTTMSREAGIIMGLKSSKACRVKLVEIEGDLPKGRVIWFAEMHSPDGKRFVIHKGDTDIEDDT